MFFCLFGKGSFYIIYKFSFNLTISQQVSFLDLVQKHLLKSCQSIRQLYGNSLDEESKIRE